MRILLKAGKAFIGLSQVLFCSASLQTIDITLKKGNLSFLLGKKKEKENDELLFLANLLF